MVLVFALVGIVLCGLFGRIRHDDGRRVFELSVSRRQMVLYAAFKECAGTAWLKHRAAVVVLAVIATIAGLAAAKEPKTGRTVTGFTWISGANPAGYRVWTIDKDGQWHEHYPDGHQAKFFDITVRGTANGCDGFITKQSATPFPIVFIPDVGCKDMTVLSVWGQGPWGPLGAMTTISTVPPTASGDPSLGARRQDLTSELYSVLPRR